MRRVLALLCVAAAGIACDSDCLFADVNGQTFVVDAIGSDSSQFKARIQFGALGIVGIDIEDAGDATGSYIATEVFPFLLGGLITNVEATGISPDDGYLTQFTAQAIDIKQFPPFTAGFLADLVAGVPATITGTGKTSAGVRYRFSGEELLETEPTGDDEPASGDSAGTELDDSAAAPERTPKGKSSRSR